MGPVRNTASRDGIPRILRCAFLLPWQIRPTNWCLKYCSAKRLGFPRGEAVMRSMTDEDRRNLFSSHAVRKKAACLDFFHTICVHMATKLSPFLIRPYGAPSPRGKVFRKPLDFQTPICRTAALLRRSFSSGKRQRLGQSSFFSMIPRLIQ